MKIEPIYECCFDIFMRIRDGFDKDDYVILYRRSEMLSQIVIQSISISCKELNFGTWYLSFSLS